MSLASAVRGQVAALNKDQAVFNVRTMEQIVAQSVATRRFSMLLLTVFALVALALASLGIYGLMSYAVAQRTREIGVRMALGAQASDVLKLVIRQGMKLAFVGVALGLVASLALTRMMKNLLFGVSATDPVTFAAIALLLTLRSPCWPASFRRGGRRRLIRWSRCVVSEPRCISEAEKEIQRCLTGNQRSDGGWQGLTACADARGRHRRGTRAAPR